MKKLFIAVLMLIALETPAASAENESPLLTTADTNARQQIFAQQQRGVLTAVQAARLQVRRQSIMQEAADRRSRNKGVLPTGDCTRLVRQLDNLKNLVSRMQ